MARMFSIRAFLSVLCVAVLTMLIVPTVAPAAVINVTFTNRWNDQANWPGATQQIRMQNRDRATSNVQQAAANWSATITDNFNLAVEVDWNIPFAFGNLESNVCGVGGVTDTQMVLGVEKPKDGRIILNSNLGNNWFFDPTPALHEEFQPVANQPWHGTAKAWGPAAGKVDMVSCAKHEFGHTLGFLRDVANNKFTPYINETADGDVDLNDFNIAIPVGNLNNLNASSHYAPGGNVPGTLIPVTDLLMVEHSNNPSSDRVVMSPYDISGVAKVLGLNNQIGYNLVGKGDVVPEPASGLLFAAGTICLLHRRRRS